MVFRSFVICLLLLPFVIWDVNGQDWEQELAEDGINVYTRAVPGKKYKEFKATITVEASIHSLLALFKEVDKMPDWLSQCEESTLISSQNFWHQITYHEVDVPLFRNRDMLLEMSIMQNSLSNTFRIDMIGRPDLMPEKDRKIRIKEVQGYWICKDLGDGRLSIEYSMYLDPAGIIPSWLYNKRIKNDPYNTLLALRKTIQNRHFKQAYYHEVTSLAER